MLKNKKLLILGASPDEISLVLRAKELGIYTIVTDQYIDWNISPAKKNADEAWNISWSDVNLLEKLCRQHKVDGITAGYSENRIEKLILLCEKLSLPCYITKEQLDITRDKAKFKIACRKNGVPVVKQYPSPDMVETFPVIVKPVDRGGSIGISVANNKEELAKAYLYAMEASICKAVIIEDFISDATKIDVYYAVNNGEVTLLTSSDTIHAIGNSTKRVVQSGWLFPSRQHAAFVQKVDLNMRNMIEDWAIQDGYIFFSGFVNKTNEFVFFETGFRLCGAHIYAFTPYKGLVNNLDIFLYHALTGSTMDVVGMKEKVQDYKTVILNMYSKKGIIKEIKGIKDIERLPDCCFALQHAHIGQECNEKNAILTKIGMFTFGNPSSERLMKDVEEAYKIFSTIGMSGEDLVYDRVDPIIVREWWNN